MSDASPQPRVGVGVIVWRDGRVLLGQRKGAHGAGTWALPGGHLEFGETVEHCAQREVREETGLEITVVARGPYTNDVFADVGKHYVTVFVIAHAPHGEPRLCEPAKCGEWRWCRWSDMPEPVFPPLAPAARQRLRTRRCRMSRPVQQALGLVSLVVRDYDEALDFYVGTLGFTRSRTASSPSRTSAGSWSRRRVPPAASCCWRGPPTTSSSRAWATRPAGVCSCSCTPTTLARDHAAYRAKGVVFVREPKSEPYGTVAVFRDLYGNLWDLLQPARPTSGA